jgi:hypothetical protein
MTASGIGRSTEILYGFCQCGCGQRTSIVKKTQRSRGRIKGEPMRYIAGHARRSTTPETEQYEVDPKTGCWVWQGAMDAYGYGKAGHHRKAHRVFYEQHRGPIPEGLELDHLCHNRACVNPDHLEAVTHAENMRRSPKTKLTMDDARAIRASSELQRVLAARFGVEKSCISRIQRGLDWREEHQ